MTLNALMKRLDDGHRGQDHSRLDLTGQYDVIPSGPGADCDAADLPLNAPDAGDVAQEADDNEIPMPSALDQLSAKNKVDLADARKNNERRRKDLAKSDRNGRVKVASAMLNLLGLAGVLGRGVLVYFLLKANPSSRGPGQPPSA